MEQPFVSVVTPVYNEADYIEGMLRSLFANDLPEHRYEVLVVDGRSGDGTREVVERLRREHANLRLLDNPARTVPHAMNLGIRAARGDVIVRVDGHAEVAPSFLRTLLEELEAHPECACVGGAIENVHENPVAEAVARAMSSPFGVGDARYRLGAGDGYVDTLLFGAYRASVFDEIGPFDEVLTRNQDDELNYRLTRAGHRIWLSSRISSRYYVRGSFRKLWRQFFQYGYWKVYVNKKHRTVTTLRQLAPIALVAFLLLGGLAAGLEPSLRLPYAAVVGLYLLAALAAAVAKTPRPVPALRVVASFLTMHIAYGLGYLQGLVDFFLLDRTPRARNAQPTR